jgi:hypothetical protein
VSRRGARGVGPWMVAGLLAVAGCDTPGATAASAPASGNLRVGLLEWRIVTSTAALTAGEDRLTVTNTGATAHDLHVTGPGVQAHTPLLPPGGTATLTVRTRAGETLTLTCEVTGHEDAGMHSTLRVVG